MSNSESPDRPSLQDVLNAKIIWRKQRGDEFDGPAWRRSAVSLPLATQGDAIKSYRPMDGDYNEIIVRTIDSSGEIAQYAQHYIFELTEWSLEKPIA